MERIAAWRSGLGPAALVSLLAACVDPGLIMEDGTPQADAGFGADVGPDVDLVPHPDAHS